MNRILVGPRPRVPLAFGSSLLWLFVVLAGIGLVVEAAFAQERSRAAARREARSKAAAKKDRDRSANDAALRDSGELEEAASPAETDPKKPGKELSPLTLRDLIKYAEASRAAVHEVKDYTAIFKKTEVVKGRRISQEMDMKFRTKPFSVYFKYRTGPEAGRQAIFVEGKYGNNLIVKEVGIKALAGPLSLKPESSLVMGENRYPVTQVGIGNILEKSLKVWERESQLEGTEIDVKFYPAAKLKDLPCEVVQLTYLHARRDFEFSLTRVYFDKESKLPVRAERFGWPRAAGEKAPLAEDYTYTNLKINQKLTDADFDPARYGF